MGLNTANGAEHGNHTIENTHGAFNFDGEVDVSGGVDDVHTVVFPARGNGRCRDRDPALPLLGHPVGDSCTVVHLADFVHHARIEQNPFCRRGFARINVRSDTNISDAFQGKGAGHRSTPGVKREKAGRLYMSAMNNRVVGLANWAQ